jgi:hypothetical protein
VAIPATGSLNINAYSCHGKCLVSKSDGERKEYTLKHSVPMDKVLSQSQEEREMGKLGIELKLRVICAMNLFALAK